MNQLMPLKTQQNYNYFNCVLVDATYNGKHCNIVEMWQKLDFNNVRVHNS